MVEEGLLEKAFAPGSMIVLEYIDAQGMMKKSGSRVEDLEASFIILQAPRLNNFQLVFHESQELTLRRLDGEHKEAYMTTVFVIDVRKGEQSVLVCSKPKRIDRSSLRRYSRFNVNMPFKYIVDGQVKEQSGTIRDLSLSGCYALIDPVLAVSEGSSMQLSLAIPGEEKELSLQGKIARVDDPDRNDRDKAGLAVDYYDLTDPILETLYGYIFQLQLTVERYPEVTDDVEGR